MIGRGRRKPPAPFSGAARLTRHALSLTRMRTATLMVASAGAATIALGLLWKLRQKARQLNTKLVRTPDGIALPYEITGPTSSPLRLVVGHGLGSSDPSAKSHASDASRDILLPVLDSVSMSASFFTARGHGESSGWEGKGTEQFHWRNLAKDVVAVAEELELPKFIAVGNSMGAATMLCLALQQPERVAALILYRPPTIFEARASRRSELIKKAEELRSAHGARWPYYETLVGSAECNLPPASDPCWQALRSRRLPVLILSHGEDAVHPIQSGVELAGLLGDSCTLQVAANEAEAQVCFPPLVRAFLQQVDNDVSCW